MRPDRLVGLGALLLAMACSPQSQSQQAAPAEGNGHLIAASCRYVITPPDADGIALLRGNCDAPAKGLAQAIERSASALRGARELALGRSAFVEGGIFERCMLLAKLKADPRWKPGIDSAKAMAPIRDALSTAGPSAPIHAALAAHGKRVKKVSVETVLLQTGARTACAGVVTPLPTEAQVWLVFD